MSLLRQRPGFDDFFNAISRSRGNELWEIVKPMMHQKSSRDWEDLFELVQEAHKLALMMYSGAEEYKFETPTIGQRFQRATMIQRDPWTNVNPPEQLEASGATVRLGITPHVTIRSNNAAGHVRSATVLPAQVLIKTGS